MNNLDNIKETKEIGTLTKKELEMMNVLLKFSSNNFNINLYKNFNIGIRKWKEKDLEYISML